MSKLLNHTIILRTKDRPFWLKNTLLHYAREKYRGLILIIDDSSEGNFDKTRINISSKEYSSLQVKLVKGRGSDFPSEKRSFRILKSTFQALELLDTDYYSISSDDDFCFPTFSEWGVSFLSVNPEFSAVFGPEIKIFYNASGAFQSLQYKGWKGCYFDDPLDRLFQYYDIASNSCAGVCRSSMFEALQSVSSKLNRRCFDRTSSPTMQLYDEELPWMGLIHLAGKVKYQHMRFMGVRNIHESHSRAERLYLNRSEHEARLGLIWFAMQEGARTSLSQTHEDHCELVHYFGTKYDKDLVSDSVMRMLGKYFGRAALARFTDEAVDYFKPKATRTFDLKILLLTAFRLWRKLLPASGLRFLGRLIIIFSPEYKNYRCVQFTPPPGE